jgi:predicted O-methyltransferase YrrM
MKEFTTDWFSFRIPHWQELVLPVLLKCGAPRYLEIGSYEGRSACWVAEQMAEKPGAEVHCVDIWGNPTIEARFDTNTADLPAVLVKHKKPSMEWLAEAITRKDFFDAIYVDGDHQAKSALLDSAMAWPLLRPGGVMIIDDYLWKHPETAPKWKLPPKPGVDAFLHLWGREINVLRTNWQVYIQKIA